MATIHDQLRDAQARFPAEGRILDYGEAGIAIFDPALAVSFDQENFRNLQMPQPPSRWLPFVRPAPIVEWARIRSDLAECSRALCTPRHLAALRAAMVREMAQRAGDNLDITRVLSRVIIRPLIPTIADGLSPREMRAVLRDVEGKFDALLIPSSQPLTRREQAGIAWRGTMAGRAVSREIRRRTRGRAPAREDFLQTIIGSLDTLGLSRATYVGTTLLTAISGAPSAVAACMVFELLREDGWLEKIGAELRALPEDALLASPVKAAPQTYHFIREVLRLWAFPLAAHRRVIHDFQHHGIDARENDIYMLSSFVTHRDPDHWKDPERFDPDRWIDYKKPKGATPFVPFGWGHRTCIGASLGLAQLFLLCDIVTRDFRIITAKSHAGHIRLEGIAVPIGFHGTIRAA